MRNGQLEKWRKKLTTKPIEFQLYNNTIIITNNRPSIVYAFLIEQKMMILTRNLEPRRVDIVSWNLTKLSAKGVPRHLFLRHVCAHAFHYLRKLISSSKNWDDKA